VAWLVACTTRSVIDQGRVVDHKSATRASTRNADPNRPYSRASQHGAALRAQIPKPRPIGSITIADHTRDETIEAIARRVLETAPPRFAPVGLSMGGYIALEIARRAPDRVIKLALLDTSVRPDTPDQKRARLDQIAYAESAMFAELPDMIYPFVVHPDRQDDEAPRKIVYQMAIDIRP